MYSIIILYIAQSLQRIWNKNQTKVSEAIFMLICDSYLQDTFSY